MKKAAKAVKAVKKVAKAAKQALKPAAKPTVVKKPARPTAPSLPLPPPPPPPPPVRDEMLADRDIARLIRYGEKFGAKKIDVRPLPAPLPVASNAIAVCDPSAPKSWRVFDRPVSPGRFRVMQSFVRDGDKERLAAIFVHVGHPPIAKWTVAHYRGQKKPKSPDQLPRCPVTSGWLVLVDAGAGSPGPIAVPAAGTTAIETPLTDGRSALALPCAEGEYAAYWAVDANDKPILLVVDFDVLTQKDWKAKPV